MDRERIEVSDGNVRESSRNHLVWIGWVGIVVGILSFVYSPFILGIIAVVLGVVSIYFKSSTLGWISIVLGAIGVLGRWFFHGGF
ncbi:MAG TPA: hypothetical protein VJ824_09610 [Bacillota bacterium]|nr:hypothetical protein [Bacillota bacterium]